MVAGQQIQGSPCCLPYQPIHITSLLFAPSPLMDASCSRGTSFIPASDCIASSSYLDIFSGYVTGWMVTRGESASLENEFIARTCECYGIEEQQLAIHSDRKHAMTYQLYAVTGRPEGGTLLRTSLQIQ